MTFVLLDDNFADGPKMVRAGHVAGWLWVCGLTYCNRHLTDGFIPHEALPTIGARLPDPDLVAAKLVHLELWDEVPGGWEIHDYHDYQPSADEVKAKRAARSKAGRLGGRRSGAARRNSTESLEATVGAKQNEASASSKTEAIASSKREAPACGLVEPHPIPSHPKDPTDPIGGSEPRQKAPRQDVDPETLSPAAIRVRTAIDTDSSLAPICGRPNELARDLAIAGPGLDVAHEVQAAGAWLRANPTKAKSNGNRFLLNWVRKAQDDRGGRGPMGVAAPQGALPGFLVKPPLYVPTPEELAASRAAREAALAETTPTRRRA